jgi:hypothetical protein
LIHYRAILVVALFLQEVIDMTFRDARDPAAAFGAKLPAFDHTSPVAGCWIDRIEWLPQAAAISERALADAIEEANRYAGQ